MGKLASLGGGFGFAAGLRSTPVVTTATPAAASTAIIARTIAARRKGRGSRRTSHGSPLPAAERTGASAATGSGKGGRAGMGPGTGSGKSTGSSGRGAGALGIAR